ncbi:MAG TPA: hypothetical protein VE953_07580 [Terriglobales bacterium]|nr:hypothetical protein [Terriglobales bacterium]
MRSRIIAIVVPAWSLALAFVAGLAVGFVVCRLAMGRGRSNERLSIAAPTEPEPVAPATTVEASSDAPSEEQPSEDPASAVDDVVAELERRVKGRRTEGEADRTTGGRRGRKE